MKTPKEAEPRNWDIFNNLMDIFEKKQRDDKRSFIDLLNKMNNAQLEQKLREFQNNI